MNTNQLSSIVRTLLKIGAAAFIAHHCTILGTLLNSPDIIAAIIGLVGVIWSHLASSSGNSGAAVPRGPILALALGLSFCISAEGQTVTITGTTTNSVLANNIPNFFSQAMTWGSSFDTNKSWTGVTSQFEDGLNQATTGAGASDYIRAQYNFSRWNVTVEGDFFGVGSSFNAIEGGGGFALIQKHDFKTEINILLGVCRVTSPGWKFHMEGELKITKMMTENTYATAAITIPYTSGESFSGSPGFKAGLGITF